MARLKRFERRHAGWPRTGIGAFAILVGGLWVTGIALWMWPADEIAQLAPEVIRWRRAAAVTHGAGAWIFCLLVGRWVWPHIALVWARRADLAWWLGTATAAIVGFVALSGLLLLYGPADAQPAVSIAHWWTAVGWPAVLLLHVRHLLRRAPPSH